MGNGIFYQPLGTSYEPMDLLNPSDPLSPSLTRLPAPKLPHPIYGYNKMPPVDKWYDIPIEKTSLPRPDLKPCPVLDEIIITEPVMPKLKNYFPVIPPRIGVEEDRLDSRARVLLDKYPVYTPLVKVEAPEIPIRYDLPYHGLSHSSYDDKPRSRPETKPKNKSSFWGKVLWLMQH